MAQGTWSGVPSAPAQAPLPGQESPAASGPGVRPAGARAWMLTAITAWAVLAGSQLATAGVRVGHVLLAAVMVGCAGICLEAARWQGLPDGVTSDLLTAWCLPVALLLPPPYALCAPPAAVGLYQIAARRGPALEQAFRAAALGLAGGGASSLFRFLGAAGDARWFAHPVPLSAAVASAGLFGVVSVALAAVAAHAADPVAGWREAAWGQESLLLDLAGLCAGLLVAIACAVSPALLVVAMPPVMLLQRSLPHRQLRAAALADAKTGLLHAAAWQREAEARIHAARLSGAPAALLLIDIDHFKRVNDVHGHLAGDEVLLVIAAALRQQLGDHDVLGTLRRRGVRGTRPGAGPADACAVAGQVRERVAALAVHVERRPAAGHGVRRGGSTARPRGRPFRVARLGGPCPVPGETSGA